MRARSREPDNEKDATREARWAALGKHFTGVFGSLQVIQSSSQCLFDEVEEAFLFLSVESLLSKAKE
jgi:hypothetical protein